MDKLKNNYDRVLLIGIGLITLVAGSMLIMKSFAVGNNYPDVQPGDGSTFEDPPVEKVASTTKLIDEKKNWEPTLAENSSKIHRLMASVPLVWKEDVEEPIDLFDEKIRVRPELSNKYLMDYKLPYNRSDVASLDLDGDGFTNAEEFKLGATDPNDKDDYPEATYKFEVAEIIKKPYIVVFNSQAGTAAGGIDFSVKRVAPPGGRLSREERMAGWAKLGESVPEAPHAEAGRFKLLTFGEKSVKNERTKEERVTSVLTIEDTTTGAKIDLPKNDKVDIPIYSATFTFKGRPLGKEFLKGDTLKLDGTKITLKVTKIDDMGVELQSTEEGKEPKTITKALGSP